MNETLNAILRQIIVEPDVDLHRLVYADALDERGEDTDQWHAKFIRGSIEHERMDYEHHRYPSLYYVGFEPVRNNVGAEFNRGFAWKLECTAETFLKHADELLWHPTQVVKSYENCIHCGGRGSLGRTQCDRCEDGRRVVETPRPCPPTAQPIRKVVLTTEPRDTGHLNDFALWKKMERGEPWRSHRWPTVEFELPADYRRYVDIDLGNNNVRVIEAGAPIHAGQFVVSDAEGRAIPANGRTGGYIIGTAVTDSE